MKMNKFIKQLFCIHKWKLIKYHPLGTITNVPLKDIECKKCHKRKRIFEHFDQNYYNV